MVANEREAYGERFPLQFVGLRIEAHPCQLFLVDVSSCAALLKCALLLVSAEETECAIEGFQRSCHGRNYTTHTVDSLPKNITTDSLSYAAILLITLIDYRYNEKSENDKL